MLLEQELNTPPVTKRLKVADFSMMGAPHLTCATLPRLVLWNTEPSEVRCSIAKAYKRSGRRNALDAELEVR